MSINNDKTVFEALEKVLQHPRYAHIAEAFRYNQDALQTLFPCLNKSQQHILECYVHSLADVYVAALTILLEKLDSPV